MLDARITKLAQKYRPLAQQMLREAIRIPAEYIDRSVNNGGDPRCGISNHEGPRLEYLKRRIVEVGAVDKPEDVGYDAFGNLVWTVADPTDGIAADERMVIYFDGHTDTVQALRGRWIETTGGVDAYDGLTDIGHLNREFLRGELGYLPPDEQWEHLVWGRGAADQLGGVVCQIIATKVLLELRHLGALNGVTVFSYGTVAEEDNDGGGPMYLLGQDLLGARAGRIPDVVILTEGTGDAAEGAAGIYRGQRGRMQIEVEVTGKSCHGSMPWEGRNPLEHGAAVIVEAAEMYQRGEGFDSDPFLGAGSRTASAATLDTPSDCAVPERFTFRFDRRLTAGEDAAQALDAIENLTAVQRARVAGLTVDIRAPRYGQRTWSGFPTNNLQIYPGWVTPEHHLAIQTAVDAYRRVASPMIPASATGGQLRKDPRVGRWIFSTDGVGFTVKRDESALTVPESKRWVTSGVYQHPAMFGIGPGLEQNTHKIGECVDARELPVVVACLARFPSLYSDATLAQRRQT